MNLGILAHIKTLEGYNNHKPIIALSTDVFEDYYDYFISNGYLFIITVQQMLNIDVPAAFVISVINPDDIETVFVDKELNINMENITDVTPSDFGSLAKTLIEGMASGVKNYGIPYTSATVNVMDKVIVINETTVTSGNMFSVENSVLDASMHAKTGKQGEIYKVKRVISEFSKISAISIPLNGAIYTPIVDVCGEDILDIVHNYIKNLHIENGTPMVESRSYHKGEHVYVNVKDNNGNISKRYYVSKIEGNLPLKELPKDDSLWLDITNDVVNP